MRDLDPIAILDVAYRKAGGMEAWWRAVGESLTPALHRGLGMFSYVLPLDTMRPTNIVDMGAPPSVIDLTLEGAKRVDRREALLAVDPAGLYANSEVFPEVVDLDDFADGLALSAPDGERALHVLVVPSPRRESIDGETKLVWKRLALHLAAAIRLQRQEGTIDDPEVDAVLSPDGRLLHKSPALTDEATCDALREQAVRIDRARARRGEDDGGSALAIWQGLLLGRWSMVDQFDTDGRRFLLARRNDPDSPAPRTLTRRQRQVVFYASLGLAHKQIGYALGITEATVATHLSLALDKLGIETREELIRVVGEIVSRDRAG